MEEDPTAATTPSDFEGDDSDGEYAADLERATRGLLALNVVVLEQMEKRIGLAPLRALQSLQRLGPSLVTELGADLDLVPSTASRLSDRLAEAGLITRSVSPRNRRATILELTELGRSILDDLVCQRVSLIRAVAEQMTTAERDALLTAAAAFSSAYYHLTDT
ncbi:putative HTH-type transcriptional regulator YusO [Mycobacterium basiliense]|uniref:Putative HTH-type transcriptional regulator YusO n=1 Tax=Mycobacterium basiliense TaxID=2094119 RepID=A0A3S5CZM5_9MYCO|nr:MarR family transcriptional regulator [Mycobacterium basiliense]VDM87911.1 putative HTH-type transcriptional regulator YusO [Mycobacterium basiliense]